jgi:Tfp pilus assembly protein PilX
MNKKPNLDRALIHYMLRAQQIARQDGRSDRGYAMLIVSLVSIAMFSMLAAYMTMTNLSKSSTNAYVDGTNTFYAAESGLNKRAQQVREKFINYATPTGTPVGGTTSVVSAAAISNCFSVAPGTTASSDDFECRNFSFRYNNNIAASKTSEGETVISEQNDNQNSVNYVAYTFVADNTKYTDTAKTVPPTKTIDPDQAYAGLKALEYQYTVYATANANQNVASGITQAEIAAKAREGTTGILAGDSALVASYNTKLTAANAANASRATSNTNMNTVLEMNFKSRIVPLFQFAAFYDGDLEMSSSSNMTLRGWVHTNGNLYSSPYTTDSSISTTFLSKVTAAGSIYNRIDANTDIAFAGITRVLLTGADCSVAANCKKFPDYLSTNTAPISVAGFSGNLKDGTAGTTVLKAPEPGFLRKRNYYNGTIGEYYAKADVRLEMVPDRDVTNTGVTPWNRNLSIIPFNFTAIRTGGTAGTCTTTKPTQPTQPTTGPRIAGADPANTYIDPDRKDASTLTCNVFGKGQLQSLRQPVLVLKNADATLQTAEDTTLGKPSVPTGLPTLSVLANTPATKQKILRALQVAIVSTPSPVAYDKLGSPLTDTALATVKTEFDRLISTPAISALLATDGTDKTKLLALSPNQIAALGGAWFLPAPIQRVESNNVQDTTRNLRRSGFYDGREKRWITMLQTNIASLSVWNRDGLYVDATDNTLTTAYATDNTNKDVAFNSGTGANLTDGLAFNRAAADATKPAGSFPYLGLASTDTTEGGLVLYATVNDDLNGDGAISAANDVMEDTSSPILKKNADGTNVMESGSTVTIDYPRKYRGGSTYQSPFGFAFNGADYLPGALTLVTDQAAYVQGDFNNNRATQPAAAANTPSSDRLPASIIGDTITILSNQCISTNPTQSATNHLGVPASQIHCGLPRSVTDSVDVTVGGTTATYYSVSGPTAVNAAFLSYTQRSVGNLGTGRGYTSGGTNDQYSGGINNYMRMLENWGGSAGRFFNYSGSFVSLGTPLEYSGVYFGSGTYYNIPQRNYNFDENFTTFSKLPPLSPRAVYLQQDVFKRAYN